MKLREVFRNLKDVLNTVCVGREQPTDPNPSQFPPEWRITGIRISSRSSADVVFGDRTVRIPGELLIHDFLGAPEEMFWLAEEDRELWPWRLPPERRQNRLSEAERQAVMDAVKDYCRPRSEAVRFLTRELEGRALALAREIQNGQLTKRKAAAALRREFPELPEKFCRDLVTDVLAGCRWYRDEEVERRL